MPRRKLVIASMMHETNTFSSVPTPLESFRPLSGDAAIAELENTNTQVGGFLDAAQRMGAEIVVPLTAGAHPSGYVERGAYEDMCDAIVGGIRGGCDAAFLALHGAMVAEHVDDRRRPRLPHAAHIDDGRERHRHHRLPDLPAHRHGGDGAARREDARTRAPRRSEAGHGVGHPAHAHQHARAHAVASAHEGRDGHGDRRRKARPRPQRVGARRLPAVGHPASVVLRDRRVRRRDRAGPGVARAHAGSRVAAARGLSLQGCAARLADRARADADGGARHPRRPRRQHRVWRHAGRDERGGGGDAPGPRRRSRRPDL